uniref:RING-CH-type domain-containing protein n=1 Tax=viral metagenome TaxID=1070528 RepID=A0A6C0BBW8_9ZZZZ
MSEDELPVCRFCYENEGIDGDDKFISPCCCSGDMLFVHKKCLNTWINGDLSSKTYEQCSACRCKYKRQKPEDLDEIVEKNTLITVLTLECGLFVLLLLLILSCSNSTIFCSITIFILYILSISYICGVLGYDDALWLIIIIFIFVSFSKRNIKLFSANLWLILFFGSVSFQTVTEGWNYFNSQNKKFVMNSFKPKMFDNYLKKYVDIIF